MGVRKSYEQDLTYLKQEVLAMGKYVKYAFEQSLLALKINDNQSLTQNIVADDKNINSMELKIMDAAMLTIAKQQPVATDLRRCIVALKMAGDLERMGDIAVDIAKGSARLSENRSRNDTDQLTDMAEIAKQMFDQAMEAYENQELMHAQRVASLDDHVDSKYKSFIQKQLRQKADEVLLEDITQLSFIGRYIERFADHTTNLAEWVVYEVNGQHFDLN
ncbi:phosphate signaling complex protein PhoU [Marinococcus halophilus]|uniref:Phosphate-specific transport system accessory protein PhoU n=1 Tax=Marinococcus halophilus TaxID=1371 RepID=A0A510Y408_MARHA|nr:phosphate signaling complex protein PhoU [Marinococcus halophilus]GEK58044.1 phosphate transport system regulatory protein PhoU [Marinococcus halophilus]